MHTPRSKRRTDSHTGPDERKPTAPPAGAAPDGLGELADDHSVALPADGAGLVCRKPKKPAMALSEEGQPTKANGLPFSACRAAWHCGLSLVNSRARCRFAQASAPDTGNSSHGPAWLISILEKNSRSPIYLSDTLAGEVFFHVAMNHDPLYANAMPLALGVGGVFGCGKTVGVREILQRIGCELVGIQASELESPHAGVPAQLILARYVEASKGQAKTDRPHVIVLDDVHMALSVGPHTTNTINTQLVAAALMNICDCPSYVSGLHTERIPIITTGNNYSGIYGALIRAGRMRVVTHELSATDRGRIATHILRGCLTPQQVAVLVVDHPGWEMAKFRQLKALLLRSSFNRRHANKTASQVLSDLLSQRPIDDSIEQVRDAYTQEDVDAAVDAIADEVVSKRDFTRIEHPTNEPGEEYKEAANVNDADPHTNRTTAPAGDAGDAEHDRAKRRINDAPRYR